MKDLTLTDNAKKGLRIIQKATDGERYKYSKLLTEFIEDRIAKLNPKKHFYEMSDSDSRNIEILEHMNEIKLKNSIGKTMSIESACGLLMQLLRTREKNNVRHDELDEHEDDITSDEIRRLIQDQGCQQLYDLIFEHMVNVIEDKKSTIALCSKYLSEALLNHKGASLEDKKYVENSIGRTIKREISKREMNKSSNVREQLNKQFSPTASDEGNAGVIIGMNKKKNKGFDLKMDDYDLDDQDKQALGIEDEEYSYGFD